MSNKSSKVQTKILNSSGNNVIKTNLVCPPCSPDNFSNNNINEVENNTESNKTDKEYFELIKYALDKFLSIISTDINSTNIKINNKEEIYKKVFLEVNKSFKIQSIKKQRRSIPSNQLCMGRKLDNLQCTRRRLNGKEYCKSHFNKLTNGRIDSPSKKPTTTGKRGRKRKVKIDDKYNDENYKTFFPCVIKGKKYLSDIENNIFEFVNEEKDKIKYLGVLTLEGKIEYIEPIIN